MSGQYQNFGKVINSRIILKGMCQCAGLLYRCLEISDSRGSAAAADSTSPTRPVESVLHCARP